MENAMTETLLIVEDDHEVRRFLHDALAEAGYRVAEASTAAYAESLARETNPAAILLDLGLPDRDGMQLLRALRDNGAYPPTIVLSSRDGDTDKVEALDAGADDYVTKPFSTAELLARIRLALRHARAKPIVDEPTLEAGAIKIDQARHQVVVEGRNVRLTPIEFRLLVELARRAGKVMTHKQLLEAVWTGKSQQVHYLRVHMQALRRKIEPEPSRPRWLTTEPGIGYRLRVD
jgi:two-component system KDP operon response regulator KdpE